jgi:hypothetical protein
MIVLRAPFDYLGAQGDGVQAMALTMFAQAAVLAVLAVALTVAAMRALPRVEGVPGVGQGRSA